jgi:hypothetical protein
LFEINCFQVVINVVAGVGYCLDRFFKALDQRPEAAAPSAQEEGAYFRIRRDIFGGDEDEGFDRDRARRVVRAALVARALRRRRRRSGVRRVGRARAVRGLNVGAMDTRVSRQDGVRTPIGDTVGLGSAQFGFGLSGHRRRSAGA